MTLAIPDLIDERSAAEQGASYAGHIPVSDLDRLLEISAEGGDEAAVTGPALGAEVALRFFEDESRWVHVYGRVEYAVRLQCSRCLEPVDSQGDIEIDGMVVSDDDQAAGVPRQFEPTISGENGLDARELVGDEILLALPQAIHCDRSSCLAEFESADSSDSGDTEGERWRPFANLRN